MSLTRLKASPFSRSGWLVLAAWLLGSCESGTAPPVEPEPVFLGAAVEANPHNTISARVVARAVRYDSAFVRFWYDGGPVTRSPAYGFGPDSTVTVPVLGLDTSRTYRIVLNLVNGRTVNTAPDTLSFTSGTLPDWIPVAGAQGSDTTPGYLVLSYPGGPVIIDNLGRVVWYRSFPNGVLNSFQAHATGRYTVLGLRDSTGAFHVLDELGDEVGTIACVGYETRFHDLLITPSGDTWILCNDTRTMDLSALGGVDTARVTATVLQRLSPEGEVLFEWNAFDHFAITDLPPESRGGANVNFTHGNAIELDTDGNVLLSFRSLNEITKVNATTGEVMWRFGGLRNQFTIIGDPKGSFERQHGMRRAGPGQIQFLDNGNGPPSRFVRYALDERSRTALLLFDFRDSPTTFTVVGGATQYYASNGHGVVTFGRAGRVVEVDRFGRRAWELVGIDGVYVFRVQRIRSLYAPGKGEPTR